jgi:parvulin-like peptidyl-prolyl isomerase
MTRVRVPVALTLTAVAFVVACGAGSSTSAAKAGSAQLSVDRLADIMATAQAPLEVDVARSIAELWVNYHLAGAAAARSDTITENAVMDAGLWSAIDNIRVRQLYEAVSSSWSTANAESDQARYDAGEVLSARHILVQVSMDAPPAEVEAARAKAEAIRAEATPANFVRLAARSDEPGAGERGGDLGLFGAGDMVPEFEAAVRAMPVGEVSPVVRTAFGFHVIYRKPFSDVAGEASERLQQRNLVVAESTFLASMESAANVKLSANAASLVKEAARSPLALRTNNATVADFAGGKLTAKRVADWVAAYPPQTQIRSQLVNAPDSLAQQFVRQLVRNELLLLRADSAKFSVDPDELANLRLAFRNNLTAAWTTMGVEPSVLADSASAAGQREQVAQRLIESYFDRLVKNEVQFADVAYPVARALQTKYSFAINEAGLERAVEAARKLREAGTPPAPPEPPMEMPMPDEGTPPSP